MDNENKNETDETNDLASIGAFWFKTMWIAANGFGGFVFLYNLFLFFGTKNLSHNDIMEGFITIIGLGLIGNVIMSILAMVFGIFAVRTKKR